MIGRRPDMAPARARDWAIALAVVAATAVISTWPLATSAWLVPQHQDPLFSSWRLYQWARSLASPSDGIFAGNIFHPAADVQLYSDPVILPAVVAAPFLWAGVPVALVYSGLFWLSAVTAGLAMFACARVVSGSRGGALVAPAVFVGAPLRLEHVMHFEMLWSAFLPLTVLATVAAFEGRHRAGWTLGGSIAAQFLCCIHYGVFVLTLWPVLAGVEWLRRRGTLPRGATRRMAAGLVAAFLVVGAYAMPFQRVRQLVGDRGDAEVERYSATLGSYLSAPAGSRAWGWSAGTNAETRLHPGLVGATLAIAALSAPATPWVAAIATTTAVAVDASRGVHGWLYPVLRRLPPYRGLRVPARFGMVALTGLALLSAVGCAVLGNAWSGPAWRAAALGVVLSLAIAEAAAVVPVRDLPRTPPPVYALLGTLPSTVIAHLPMPVPEALPGDEPTYQYFAQYHRHALVNGYSGFYPPAYLDLLERVRRFPDDRSVNALGVAGVEYVLVHAAKYATREAFVAVVEDLDRRPDVVPVATSTDEGGAVRVYRIGPTSSTGSETPSRDRRPAVE